MTGEPEISFSVADRSICVTPESELWNRYLPTDRNHEQSDDRGVTLGNYFLAAESFLKINDFEVIKNASKHFFMNSPSSGNISTIDICLVKHGRFYHPSKINVRLENERSMSLALNMAFSSEGRITVARECNALERLKVNVDEVPVVFGNISHKDLNGLVYSAFCVTWFEDFHEFHLSIDSTEKQRIVVWNTDKGHRYLDEKETAALYQGVARILSDSYDLFTFEQIQPWHHAAGDFVVKIENGSTDIRLITVRQYTSLFDECPDKPEDIAEAALIFLFGMAIRTRLDRADGTGDILWADNFSVLPTFKGFFESIAGKSQKNKKSEVVSTIMKSMIERLEVDDILDYSQMVIDSYNPLSPETAVVQCNLKNHAEECLKAIKHIFKNC